MKRRIVLGVVTLAVAQSSVAVENRPKNGSRELDPFAPAIVASAGVCSERYPENARYYQAAVKAIFNGHQKEYDQLNTDIEFQKKLREFRSHAATKSKAELDSECEDVLAMGKEAMQQRKPRK
jgi:Skp family chaperone for outer membrane proteins